MVVEAFNLARAESQAQSDFSLAKKCMDQLGLEQKFEALREVLGWDLQVINTLDEARKTGGYPFVSIGPAFQGTGESGRDTLRVYPDADRIAVVLFHEVRLMPRRAEGMVAITGHTVRRDRAKQNDLTDTIYDRLQDMTQFDRSDRGLGKRVRQALQEKI